MALIEFCDIETRTITVVNARKITRVKIFTDEKTGRTGTRISIPGEVIYTNESIEEVVRRWNEALAGKKEVVEL